MRHAPHTPSRWWFVLSVACLLACGRSTLADWQLAGNSALNVGNTQNAQVPAIAGSANALYVAWQEWEYTGGTNSRSAIYVKHYNGASWNLVGVQPLNVGNTQNAYFPDMALVNDLPYVVWQEQEPGRSAIYMKHYTGSAWVQDGPAANVNPGQNASRPRIAVSSTRQPYLTWLEQDSYQRVFVKHWNGSSWIQDGGYLNRGNTQHAYAAAIAVYNTTPHVAWEEHEYVSPGIFHQVIYVKKWNGTSWEQLGGSLNHLSEKNAANPSITMALDYPRVIWQEENASGFFQIRCGYYQGSGLWFTSWDEPDHSLNLSTVRNAFQPSLAMSSEYAALAAWHEYGGPVNNAQINVRYNKTSNEWPFFGSTLNQDLAYDALNPKISFRSATAYVAWQEKPVTPNGTPERIFVKYFATPTPTITQTSTITPTFTVTRTMSVTSTITVTRTVTPTRTITLTPTPTPTTTFTPTITLTRTRTVTATASATITPWLLPEADVVAYPSPAKGDDVWFYYHTAGPAEVRLEIYNIVGEQLQVLHGQHAAAGPQRLHWNIQPVANGIYFYRMNTGAMVSPLKKLAIVKK